MLALLLPTRNKPEELKRIIGELSETPNVLLYVYVAGDDPKLEEYTKIDFPDYVIPFLGGVQLGFSGAVNFLSQQALSNKEIRLFMRCEDDFYFQDKNFTIEYIKRIPTDDVAMIWCNYVLKGPEAEPHTGAVTRTWLQTLGFFSLPNIIHYFCDNVLLDLARGIDRAVYISEPLIDHKHVANDPRKSDPVADERRKLWQNDVYMYKGWREGEDYKNDIIKLKSKLNE